MFSVAGPAFTTALKYVYVNQETKCYFLQFEIIINVLALSASFEYCTYVMGLRPYKYLIILVLGRTLDVRIWRLCVYY